MSVLHERFEVQCNYHGTIAHHATRAAALRSVSGAVCAEDINYQITVYDRMARVGQPELWNADGAVRRIKLGVPS